MKMLAVGLCGKLSVIHLCLKNGNVTSETSKRLVSCDNLTR